MSRRTQTGTLPETLEEPDVGFVAIAGVYAGAVLLALLVTGGLAVGASAPAIVGSISTAGTVGLIAGAVLARRANGFPERLGRRTRSVALPFVIPGLFAVVAVAGVVFSSVSGLVTLAAGASAVVTGSVAAVVARMAKTRYARAVTSTNPIVTVPWLLPNRGLYWIGFGVVCLAIAGLFVLRDGSILRGRPLWWSVLIGAFSIFFGVSIRVNRRGGIREAIRSSPPRRSVLDAEWGMAGSGTLETATKLQIHDAGIVLKRPMRRTFVPWSVVDDIRLTDTKLVIERRRWFDIRCDRLVIDDAEAVLETITEAWTDAVRSPDRDK
ncbi:PH domain-containing protein [Halostagnicola sp. A-GB9-2]|uniref:PH domain-containing protein n=1 Tax=Halostagnicola sp. A-GB9-2 TaxID=3048066 RepID=UPI0024BF58C1|nr:PH domain-containing protein [Halostagnicola sp. A-GB9-2]MDJ1432495.1 PH domain-containing protein [Halostagnicola sp. A-GB9-2]